MLLHLKFFINKEGNFYYSLAIVFLMFPYYGIEGVQ